MRFHVPPWGNLVAVCSAGASEDSSPGHTAVDMPPVVSRVTEASSPGHPAAALRGHGNGFNREPVSPPATGCHALVAWRFTLAATAASLSSLLDATALAAWRLTLSVPLALREDASL